MADKLVLGLLVYTTIGRVAGAHDKERATFEPAGGPKILRKSFLRRDEPPARCGKVKRSSYARSMPDIATRAQVTTLIQR